MHNRVEKLLEAIIWGNTISNIKDSLHAEVKKIEQTYHKEFKVFEGCSPTEKGENFNIVERNGIKTKINPRKY